MRLFRTEQAAREAGFKWGVSNGTRKWREDDDNNEAEIFTDRERRLLEALEKIRAMDARSGGAAAYWGPLGKFGEVADAAIRELNVEG